MNYPPLIRRALRLAAATLACLMTCNAAFAAGSIASYPADLSLPGVSTRGIFDPSMSQDPTSAQMYLTYSAVDSSARWPTQNDVVTSSRIAVSSDQGVTWTDLGVVVPYTDVTLPGASPNNAGTWISEVASTVYDPGASKSQRWKTVFMHFLLINGKPQLEDLWIGLKMASTAEGLVTASETKLFSGAGYNSGNNRTNGPTRSPLGGKPAIALDTQISPALNGCIFAEPGLLATSSALYLSIVCNRSATDRNIVILKCASPCSATRAQSWSYLGSALDTADASALGYDEGFSAPNLVSSGGNFYVIATPQSSAPWEGFYNGCMVVPFDNIETAAVARDALGAPQTIVQLVGSDGNFSGACTYLPTATAPGILYSELQPSDPTPFHVFMSGVNF